MTGSTDEMKADVGTYNAAVAAAEEAFLTEYPDSTFAPSGNLASIGAYNPNFFSTYEPAWAKNDFKIIFRKKKINFEKW